MKRFIVLLMMVSLLSCSAEKSGPANEKQAQVKGAAAVSESSKLSIQITPSPADHDSVLTVIPKGFYLNDARYAWLVNGDPVPAAVSCTLRVCDCSAKKGDTIQAMATVNGKEILSNEAEVRDTPAEFSRLKIMPEVFRPGDRLYVEAEAKDIDGDPVTISYEWTKNGQPAGTGSIIDSTVERGDKVSVKVTPYDGERYGQSVVFEREIGNMPPMVVADNTYNFDGKVFTYRCRAADPDGDTLTWSLKTAPPGMTIDPSTGLVTWRVPPEFSGRTSFTVCASDGHGGQSTQVMNFTVK